MSSSKAQTIRKVTLSVVWFLVFVAIGFGLMYAFRGMREPPRQAEITEPKLQVAIIRVHPEDVPVTITGYGDVHALDVVTITPKVPGEVVEVHPRLEQGEVIPKGGLLLRIDPQDYEITKAQAEAQIEQLRSTLALLRKKFAIDRDRVETYRRIRDLAKSEFDRDKALYENDDVGAESMVNLSEINFSKADDALDQVEQAVELYPLRIREAESGLDAALAQVDKADLALERTEVRAPFDARVKMAQVEVGQCVAPGVPVLILANDAVLEISVSLDSRDARSWLRFSEAEPPGELSWFGALEPVQCRVSWTEDPGKHYWTGVLDRVERFDQMMRTVAVAVRIDSREATAAEHGLPLVDGMFCAVEIPGKQMRQVYRLPRWSVSFEGQVFLAEEGADGKHRLRKRDVEVLRTQGEEVFVSRGLEPGERVITTRLVNPLPGSLLEFSLDEAVTAAGPDQANATGTAVEETR